LIVRPSSGSPRTVIFWSSYNPSPPDFPKVLKGRLVRPFHQPSRVKKVSPLSSTSRLISCSSFSRTGLDSSFRLSPGCFCMHLTDNCSPLPSPRHLSHLTVRSFSPACRYCTAFRQLHTYFFPFQPPLSDFITSLRQRPGVFGQTLSV